MKNEIKSNKSLNHLEQVAYGNIGDLMRPIIGVLLRPNRNLDNQDIFSLNKEIADMIIRKGGIPVGIVPPYIEYFYEKTFETSKVMRDEDFKAMQETLNRCDGMVLQGGLDFYDYDIRTIRYLYEQDIPTLGICLGMQTMGVAFDGTVDTIGNLDHKKKESFAHDVYLRPDSKIAKLLNKTCIKVNSRHKDMLDSTTLDIVGYSGDGVIEAIEDSSKEFFIGVQWHPESLIAFDENSNLLMEAFINSARKLS